MSDFIQEALRTESSIFHNTGLSNERLIHAAFGMQTETAEFTDALKKSIFYGRPLDVVNLREEIGDILWYLALACDELGTTFEAEQARVIAKLKARYPDEFTSNAALNRDLDTERTILESNH